jgi:hypothetical protein
MDSQFLIDLASSLELAAKLNDALCWYSQQNFYRSSIEVNGGSEFLNEGVVYVSCQIAKRSRTRIFEAHFADDPATALVSCIRQLQEYFD